MSETAWRRRYGRRRLDRPHAVSRLGRCGQAATPVGISRGQSNPGSTTAGSLASAQVGAKWGITGDAGPPLKFINKNSGRQVKLALVDEKSAEVVRMRDVRPQAGPGADDLVRWRLTKFDQR